MSGEEKVTMTKHDQIIAYIEALKIGSHISVRQIAKELSVSEGTAYRAMKEARELGLIISRERIGTVRVEKFEHNNLQQLTFADVALIVDGRVLGGSAGLAKTLNKFVIGAMTPEAMMSYIDAGSLLIVGNRDEAHHRALENGAGVLITGGFEASDNIKQLADRYELPIISSSHDTFTVASIINRAMYDRLIKKKMMLIQDMASSIKFEVQVLHIDDQLRDYEKLVAATGHDRFPVVDAAHRLVGIVTRSDVGRHLGRDTRDIGRDMGRDKGHDMGRGMGRDITGREDSMQTETIEKMMTRNPLTVQMQTSVTSAAHMMISEGIKLLPIIDTSRKLIGVVSRSDVIKAMQYIQNQPQLGETIDEMIWAEFSEGRDQSGQLMFRGKVTPQMTSMIGTASEGVLSIVMTQAAYGSLRQHKKANFVLENMTVYYVSPVQLEGEITVIPRIIEVSRKSGKVAIDIIHAGKIVCQAMLAAQVIDLF